MCPSSVVHHPLSIIHHLSKWRWCVSMCLSALCIIGCVQGGVHMLCELTALCMVDMARLSELLQLGQEHVGWWRSFSGFGGWYTEEEEATAQAVGPSYKSKEETAWNLLPSSHRPSDEVWGKNFMNTLNWLGSSFTKFIIFLCFLAPCTLGNSPEYWLRILGVCCRQLSFDRLNCFMERFGDDGWWTTHGGSMEIAQFIFSSAIFLTDDGWRMTDTWRCSLRANKHF